ncbi:MAG: HNH endonuclease [Clostridia bacterium]|nr:HNH endonuclease [Clostridia bacterium]
MSFYRKRKNYRRGYSSRGYYSRRRYGRRGSGCSSAPLVALLILPFIVIGLAVAIFNGFISFIEENLVLCIVLLSLGLLSLLAFILIKLTDRRYVKFVENHSLAIQRLKNINDSYKFNELVLPQLAYTYDNEVFYNEVSPFDYLVYQLVYIKGDVIANAKLAEANKELYEAYSCELASVKCFDEYDKANKAIFKKKLSLTEKRVFNSLIQAPIRDYSISVTLTLTNINGAFKSNKSFVFSYDIISDAMERLNNKNGDRYLDSEIWDSICRVERSKVSNKMRFAIYKRDGYRCRMCGISTDQLEVDHIFPIAKGGKSNFDNLQTLCHRCNLMKSDTVGADATAPKSKSGADERKCKLCGAPLVLKRGQYGSFYACPNFPKCKYTEKE